LKQKKRGIVDILEFEVIDLTDISFEVYPCNDEIWLELDISKVPEYIKTPCDTLIIAMSILYNDVLQKLSLLSWSDIRRRLKCLREYFKQLIISKDSFREKKIENEYINFKYKLLTLFDEALKPYKRKGMKLVVMTKTTEELEE